jgi:hypothetical protein
VDQEPATRRTHRRGTLVVVVARVIDEDNNDDYDYDYDNDSEERSPRSTCLAPVLRV